MSENVYDKGDFEKLLKLINTLAEHIDRSSMSFNDECFLDTIQGIALNHLDVISGNYPLKTWDDCRWYLKEIENILANEGISIL